MTGLRCGCGAAIDCTYPKCKEGVEMSQSITQMLRDYARDHTTTTYHDALIRKAATEIEFHEERWDQLRQQLAALRDHQVAYETQTEQELASRDDEVKLLRDAIEAIWTNPNWKPDTMPRALIDQLQSAYKGEPK